MTDHIFSLITGHASFDRSRFKSDMDVFSKKRRTEAPPASDLAQFVSSNGTTQAARPSSTKQNKRRKLQEPEPVDGTHTPPCALGHLWTHVVAACAVS